MREKAVKVITDEAETKLEEASVLSEKTFRDFLVKNRPTLEQKYKELATSPKLAEQSLHDLEVTLDGELSGEMRQHIAEVARNLASAERNLRRLQLARDLTPEQDVERQVWMLVRRLQMEQLNEAERTSPRMPARRPLVKKDADPKKVAKPEKEVPKKDAPAKDTPKKDAPKKDGKAAAKPKPEE